MERLGIAALIGLSALLFATAATAGSGCHDAQSMVQHIFDTADQDGNGALTAAEYADAGLERFGLRFEETDLDANGETSFDEYLELYEMHHPPAERAEA